MVLTLIINILQIEILKKQYFNRANIRIILHLQKVFYKNFAAPGQDFSSIALQIRTRPRQR
jgi:hypothetical protein